MPNSSISMSGNGRVCLTFSLKYEEEKTIIVFDIILQKLDNQYNTFLTTIIITTLISISHRDTELTYNKQYILQSLSIHSNIRNSDYIPVHHIIGVH